MEDNLKQAIRAIKAGDKVAGRQMLAQIIKINPQNELAWLWMATVVTDSLQKKQCLQTVLRYNPDNKVAQEGLARLKAETPETSNNGNVESPQIADIIAEQQPIQPPQSSGGILKGFSDTFYGVPAKVESYTQENPTRVILTSGATKARKFGPNEPVKYHGLGWMSSRRGTLILTDKQLVCGDWQIPISDIKEAFATSANSFTNREII